MKFKGFWAYFGKRFLLFILVVFSAVTINFIVPRFAPGNPIRQAIMTRYGLTADQSMVNPLVVYYEEYFGLNDPLYVQYFRFIKNTFSGDLGFSIASYPRLCIGYDYGENHLDFTACAASHLHCVSLRLAVGGDLCLPAHS